MLVITNQPITRQQLGTFRYGDMAKTTKSKTGFGTGFQTDCGARSGLSISEPAGNLKGHYLGFKEQSKRKKIQQVTFV